MKGLIIGSIGVLLMLCQTVFGQSISVQVSADRVAVGESFLVTYTIEGSVDDFTLPEFKDFKVMQSGKSTNMSIINGKISKSVGYNLTVIPLAVGTFEIGPAKAVVNGKKISSPPFTIEVVTSTTNPRTQRSQIDEPSDDWRDNILLLAEVDKKQIYVGEQVTVTYKLLRRIDFQTMEVEKEPVFKGFLSEEMEIPSQKSEGMMEYKGQKYYFQAFRKVALFGAQPGHHLIDPLTARGVILIPVKDPYFGTTLFSTTDAKMVIIASNKLNIEVLPLPLQNQPENFSGAVGQFTATRSINVSNLSIGQAATMSVSIDGWGNLKSIDPIKLSKSKNIEVYEPEITDSPRKNGEQYGGTRVFSYSIVPQTSGTITLPKEEFVYFDPSQRSYVTRELPAVDLVVRDVGKEEDMPQGNVFASDIKDGLNDSTDSSSLPIAVALASGFPLMAFILGAVWKRRKDRPNEKSDKVDGELPKFNAPFSQDHYKILAQSIREKLSYILGIQFTKDEDLLIQVEDGQLKQKIIFVLQACDQAAYSPLQPMSLDELRRLGQEIIQQLSTSKNSEA